MGVPMLKKKKDLNYRRGQTWRYCGICDHFLDPPTAMQIMGTHYPHCRIMGLKPGCAYHINKSSQCDAYDNTEGLKRLKGER